MSVLSPSTRPAQPLAKVVVYRALEEAAMLQPGDQVVYGNGEKLIRLGIGRVVAVGGVPVT